jgi:hypothetical protein
VSSLDVILSGRQDAKDLARIGRNVVRGPPTRVVALRARSFTRLKKPVQDDVFRGPCAATGSETWFHASRHDCLDQAGDRVFLCFDVDREAKLAQC